MKADVMRAFAALPVAVAMFLPAAPQQAGEYSFLENFLLTVALGQPPIPERLGDLIKLILPFFIFMFLHMTFMCRDFMSTAVYAFVREQDRVKWYAKKSARLCASAFLYYTIYFVSGVLLFIAYGAQIREAGKVMALGLWLIVCYSLFAFALLLLLNLLSIAFNSAVGYVAVGGTALAASVACCMHKSFGLLFKLNPIVWLMPDWHAPNTLVPPSIEISAYPPSASVVGFVLTAAMIFAVGIPIVKFKDITLSPGE